MSPNFDAYATYYDLLYSDKDYTREAEYVRDLLSAHGASTGTLLEFGSGTGRHGSLLAGFGYEVLGIEKSESMVRRCVTGAGFSCQQGDIRSVQLHKTFSAVISLFHVLSYQTSNADLLSVFQRAAEHTQPGGIFLFDFWYSPAVYAQKPEVRVKRMGNDHIEVVRLCEPVVLPNDNRVDVNYTVFVRPLDSEKTETVQETHQMRHLSLPEIDLLAQFTGFERVRAEEYLTGNAPGTDTWGVCTVLRRI